MEYRAFATSLEQASDNAFDIQALQIDISLTHATEHDGCSGCVHHGERCSHLQHHVHASQDDFNIR